MVRRLVAGLVVIALLLVVAAQLWPPHDARVHDADRQRPQARMPQTTEPEAAPTEPVTPPPRPPEFAPGQTVTIQLTEPPATRYLSAKTDGNDEFYGKLVAEESHGKAVYDASLGRAAREFVYQFSNLGMDPPSDVRTFLTTSSGAIAGDTVFQHLQSNSEAEGALRQAIRAVLAGSTRSTGLQHVGVGEVYQPGASLSRHIGVVGTRLDIDVDPLDRQVALAQSWHLRGRMRGTWRHLQALVLRPNGALETLPVDIAGDRLDVLIAGENSQGTVDVQVVGEGPDGPGKLVQVAVEVGQPLPTTYQAVLPPDESAVQKADQAAAYAMQLLNADRQRHHVPLLSWDARLADIAKDHSADMRDNGFFGHVSPTTGMHPDRLAKANYLAISSAENVAHNPSIFEAELGLMHSLGHRRNILDPQLTHVGVGVAGAEDDQGRRRWWVTQLFAKPTPQWTPEAAVADVQRRITAARNTHDLPPLAVDEALAGVAQDALRVVDADRLQDASGRALALAQERHVVRGRLRVWTAVTADLAQLEWPDAVLSPEAQSIGLAAVQQRDGRVALVLLVAEPRQ